ncbi:RHS repeat-associated core domain-containing protein [Xanthomonas cannabis]|uniref:RHS repeat-associated core domain-containing protein n=1 Tax=Xanthomonas cannabis TaxID=1885674 RepID=UPI000B0E2E82|nr:RHS repeat-associated core domain-containing protein [Xanthomonas cannabis]
MAQTGTHAPQTLPAASSGNSFDDNNRQTAANNVALSYDDSGNLLSDGSRTYVWDDRDRLSQIQQGGTTIASFSYDALGRRTAKTEGGTSTQYLYDGLDTVQETQGTTVNPILTGPGIDQRYARNDTGGRTYFLTDQLGSTRLLTNAAGSAVQRYDYDPYGTTTQSSTAYTNPYQYTGREKDVNGLYYYRARYYRAQWGRFVSEDPIGLSGGNNSYAYVGGNPLSYVDPNGTIAWLAIPFLCAGGGCEAMLAGLLAWSAYNATPAGQEANRNAANQLEGLWHTNENGDGDAQAPGMPTPEDGYVCPKKWDGKKVRSPNGRGHGWPDNKGNVWVPTGPGSGAHGGPHWDVQKPGGGYDNVYPGGRRRGGR